MSAHRPRLVVPLTSMSHLFPLHLPIRWPCTARKASSHPIPDSTIYVSTYRIRSDPASLRSFFGICIAVFVREMRRCRCHTSLSPRNMKLAVNMYIVHTDGIRKTRSIAVRQFPMFLSYPLTVNLARSRSLRTRQRSGLFPTLSTS